VSHTWLGVITILPTHQPITKDGRHKKRDRGCRDGNSGRNRTRNCRIVWFGRKHEGVNQRVNKLRSDHRAGKLFQVVSMIERNSNDMVGLVLYVGGIAIE
jgi:hypothetical protein